jgi:hypothetical protein
MARSIAYGPIRRTRIHRAVVDTRLNASGFEILKKAIAN